ncbi:MAG: hypothetical protein M3305_07490 [Actinomycetota bacterium]|nr:hypothetical protein [Actinomycetota bacterium]
MQVWLDDLLPFLGVLIGAAAGLFGSWLGLRWQGRAQWQRLLHEGASEFAAKLAGASTAVRHAISSFERLADQEGTPSSEDEEATKEAMKDAEWLVNEIPLSLSRLRLLFGEESRVYGEAKSAEQNLKLAVGELKDYRDKGRADQSLQDADKLHSEAEVREREFLSLANSEIRGAG